MGGGGGVVIHEYKVNQKCGIASFKVTENFSMSH